MTDSNFCFFTGVVSDTHETIKTDVVKPVVKLDLYSNETKEWDSEIRVVFVENEDARKIKGISIGDIIFVFGKLAYSDDFGYYMYADSFVILQKNKLNLSLMCCRVAYFEFCSYTNCIQLTGEVCNISKKCASIMVDRSKNVRGEIVEHDLIPIYIEVGEDQFQNGDSVRFLGGIEKNMATGTLVKTACFAYEQ